MRFGPGKLTALTIDSQIAQRGRSSPLHLRIVTRQEAQHRVERVPPDLPHFLLGDLGKCKRGRALQIDIVREGQRGQSGEGRAGKEVGCCPVYWSATRSAIRGPHSREREARTHSRGIAVSRRRLPAHSRVRGARTRSSALDRLPMSAIPPDRHMRPPESSQQLLHVPPMLTDMTYNVDIGEVRRDKGSLDGGSRERSRGLA